MVHGLGRRSLLVVIGLYFVALNTYSGFVNGWTMNIWGALTIIGVLAGITLVLIGIFAKDVKREG
ncbi:MAG TPA: hypothetical protein VEG44_07710 [Candidatus Acidoferrales bacterium]|nr:hypothetical protein [Candidatus Acidoferrales bacterium]